MASGDTYASFKIGDRVTVMAGGGWAATVIGYFVHPETLAVYVMVDNDNGHMVPMGEPPSQLIRRPA